MSRQDDALMAWAQRLAEKGRYSVSPNPVVGCVIAREGGVIGEGWHRRAGEGHAEVNALSDVRARGHSAQGATAYVTLEPCSHYGRTGPCCVALIEAGIARLVVAIEDPNPAVAGRGIARCRAAGIEVCVGVGASAAEEANRSFLHRMRHARPWVRVKLACSLDGRTALANGQSQWITGPAARRDVQWLRARSCAILAGIGTVLADDPSLNVRLSAQELGVDVVRQPLRVITDAQGQLPPDARLLSLPGPVRIYSRPRSHLAGQAHSAESKHFERVEHIESLSGAGRQFDLAELLADLAQREINELHIEAGAKLSGAFVGANLVDELVVYMAPKLMGQNAFPLLVLPQYERMDALAAWRLGECRQIGDDLRLRYFPAPVSAPESTPVSAPVSRS